MKWFFSTSKDFTPPDFIHYIYFPILILEKEPVKNKNNNNKKQKNYKTKHQNQLMQLSILNMKSSHCDAPVIKCCKSFKLS